MTMFIPLYLTIMISDNLQQNQLMLDFSFTDRNIKLQSILETKYAKNPGFFSTRKFNNLKQLKGR